MDSGRNGDFSSPTWRHPRRAGSENGAGRNTLPGTNGRVRFLRRPQPSACSPGLSALAIGGNCPSITSRGGPLRLSLRQRRQQADSCTGRLELRTGGACSHFGRGQATPLAVSSRSSVPHFSVFLRDSPSKGFRVPDAHNPPHPPITSSNRYLREIKRNCQLSLWEENSCC